MTRPEIYFGELTDRYVYVKTKQKEFDYPQGDTNTYHDLRRHGRNTDRQPVPAYAAGLGHWRSFKAAVLKRCHE